MKYRYRIASAFRALWAETLDHDHFEILTWTDDPDDAHQFQDRLEAQRYCTALGTVVEPCVKYGENELTKSGGALTVGEVRAFLEPFTDAMEIDVYITVPNDDLSLSTYKGPLNLCNKNPMRPALNFASEP